MEPGPILDPHPKGGVLDRLQYLFATMGILIFLTLGWRGRLPVMIVGGDELTYVSISRSLEAGTYREVYSASAPRHVKYPPGYPAWLLVLRKLGGDSHDLVRALNLAFVAVAIVSAYLIVRKIAGVGLALAALGVLVFNPSLLGYGATLLSEAPYAGLTGAALAVSALAAPSSSRAAYVAILLAMAAFLTRTAGITVVLAIGIWLLQRRRRSELLAFGFAFLTVVGGWLAYTRMAPHTEAGRSYFNDLTWDNPENPPSSRSRVKLAYRNGIEYATDGLPSALAVPTIRKTRVDNVLWLVVLVALIAAGIAGLGRRVPAAAWYLVLCGALLLAWPWRQDRLLIPLIPVVMAALFIGVWYFARRLRPGAQAWVAGALTLLLGLGAFRGALAREASARDCDRAHPYESPGCYDATSRSMVAASHYLRSTAPASAVVVTVSGAAVNFLSGLRTEPAQLVKEFPPGKAGEGLRARGIRYILITGGRRLEQKVLGPALAGSCTDLRLEARFPPQAFVLTTEPPQDPSEDACGPLAEVVKSPGKGPTLP